jgi:hypothetical protein
MKTNPRFFPAASSRLLLAAAVGLASLFCAEGQEHAASPASGAPVIVQKTSFTEVTSRLDQGGSLFVYLSTEDWCKGLASQVDGWRGFAASLPMLGQQERTTINNVFNFATPFIKKSGIEDLTGVGMSGIAIGDGLHRVKVAAHHYPGKDAGFLWTCLGRAPHPLDGLKMLPAETGMAGFWDLDLGLLWGVIEETAKESDVAGAPEALRGFAADFKKNTGLEWQPLLASLGNQFGIILTLDPEKKVTIPMPPGAPMIVPEPGLVIAVRVNNDLLFDRIDLAFKESPQTTNSDQPGVRIRTMPLPMPLPVTLRPTVARAGDFLFLASTEVALQQVLDAQSGKKPGLLGNDEFKKLSQGISLEGNQFGYVANSFGETMRLVQMTLTRAMSAGGGPPADVMQKLMGVKSSRSFSVSSVDKEGWTMAANMSDQPATALLLPAVAAPIGVMAGMLLPALSKAKERAQSIQCVSDLKQIGVAARLWSLDHNDTFPPDFLSMTNELGSPRILICPAAKNATQAQTVTWQTLKLSDISYELVGPGGKDDPKTAGEVFVRCPIHGHVCLRDGSVQQGKGK